MTLDSRIDAKKKGAIASLADSITVEPVANALSVLVLQHPSEAKEVFGTGRLACRGLENSKLRIGLSWRSLAQAWKEPVEMSGWAVLYLGGTKGKLPPNTPVVHFDNRNRILEKAPVIEGLIILDGTWAQAKTYWWKNPWLKKLKRVALQPESRSRYSSMRKEPRKECVSTIEAIAFFMRHYAQDVKTAEYLDQIFGQLLEKHAAQTKAKKN